MLPALPLSRDAQHYEDLRRTLVLYRMVYDRTGKKI